MEMESEKYEYDERGKLQPSKGKKTKNKIIGLPKIVKNMDGDSAIKIQLVSGRVALVDLRCVLGISDPTDQGKSVLMTSWGTMNTRHSLSELEGILYPFDSQEFN